MTIWIKGIKAGDSADIQRLWDRYFRRLAGLAGTRLPAACRRAFDEEDVALSAFQSFCERAGQGEFPRMNDREDLWRLMATITVRKALAQMRHQTRQKRGGGHVLGESALMAGEDRPGEGLAEVLGEDPTPDAVAQFREGYERLLAKLVDPELVRVALRRLEGQSTQEIAAASKVSTKTIERKLKLIRAIWSRESQV